MAGSSATMARAHSPTPGRRTVTISHRHKGRPFNRGTKGHGGHPNKLTGATTDGGCEFIRPHLSWCRPDEPRLNKRMAMIWPQPGAGYVGGMTQLMRSRDRGFRIAVAGCGYWGAKHVRVLHGLDDVEEVIVVDSCEDRARKLARSYKSASWHTALAPALAEADAVVVATPPSTHVAVALQAIEAGKHVLVEKPLAPTTRDARLLQTAAAAA